MNSQPNFSTEAGRNSLDLSSPRPTALGTSLLVPRPPLQVMALALQHAAQGPTEDLRVGHEAGSFGFKATDIRSV